MGKKINKSISLLLTVLMVVTFFYESGYTWTTEVYFSPQGHEILTRDAAYDAGDYYRGSAAGDFFAKVLSENYDYSKLDIIEAGWRKKVKKFVKKAASSTLAVAGTVAAVALVVTVISVAPIALVVVGVLAYTGVLSKIMPYYGTYNDRTVSLIAGARYQDLEEKQPGGNALKNSQENTEKQKFHFLRRNDQPAYNLEVMRDEIDNVNYGIKYKGIIEPIIEAHRLINAPRRNYHIGNYQKVNVYPDHFNMGKVLHTIQDGYAHVKRNTSTWVINDVMVYKPRGAKDHEHESMGTTMFVPINSHDRIYSYDDGFFGLHGKLKSEATQAKRVSKEILKLWKNRDAGWAGKDTQLLIEDVFKVDANPWAQIVNQICAHR